LDQVWNSKNISVRIITGRKKAMLKNAIRKTRIFIGSVKQWLDERRKDRLRRKWENAENYLENTPYNKGIFCMMEGKFGKASKLFKKAVEGDPEGSLKWYMLGEAFWEMGKPVEARESYLKAWSYRGQIKCRYIDWEELDRAIREGLARSGAVAEGGDADNL
jgi:tetratricopeptide (TPR) repeat protein